MKLTHLALLLSVLSNTQLISAHGDESPEGIAKRELHVSRARRSLSGCAEKLRKRGLHQKRLERRDMLGVTGTGVMKERDEHDNLAKRQLTDDFDVGALYPEDDRACILAPEETVGPYYLPTHLFRTDMRSSPLQSGIELRVTLQLIDVNTCEPLSNVMTEFWHCNNLGIYSGFEAEGTEGQDFLRGMQMSDEDGIVQIVTNFPGWYAGRATHIHIATHLNGTLIPSDTSDLDNPASGAGQYYTGGTTPHIGQVYFDEGFLELIDVAEPYTENTGPARLKNDEDNIFRGSGADAGIMTVTLIDGELGDVTKGLVGSSIVGIDTSKEYDVGVDRPTGPAGTGTAGNGTVVPPTGTKNVEQDTATDGGSTETGTGTGGTSSVKNAVSVPWMLASSVGAVLGYWMLR